MALSKVGKWMEMGRLIDDKLLAKIALVGEPHEIAAQLITRYGDIFDICGTSVFTGEGYSSGGYNSAIAMAIRKSRAQKT
jgi:hypothetical protein